MALIEIELVVDRFGQLVQSLASAGPIPIGTLNGLGPGRLIAGMVWGGVEIGPGPVGFVANPGTVIARADVRVRHVSTAELDADPNAPGQETGATGWLVVSSNAADLRVEVFGFDIAGTPTQYLSPPVRLGHRNIGQAATAGTIVGGAVIARDSVVTLRFATDPADNLLATPANRLDALGEEWAIRISGEALAGQLFTSLKKGITPPPGGTTIEDSPFADWIKRPFLNEWVAGGGVGLKKADACPGLFGDVDVSVTINLLLEFTTDLTVTPPLLDLRLTVSTDVSDWDSFRCWLGNGAILSLLLGSVTAPIIGVIAGIATLIAVGETIRLDAGSGLGKGKLGGTLTKVSSDDTSATYTGSQPLPSLASTGLGTLHNATVGPDGLVVSGSIVYLPATHTVGFTPDGGPLAARIDRVYHCNSRSFTTSVDSPLIIVTDSAAVLKANLGSVPVTIFPTSSAIPPQLWSITSQAVVPEQDVTIVASAAVKPGDTGRIYLHTSAGIRRYDIPPVAAIAPLTVEDEARAFGRCPLVRQFLPWEKISWLPDPSPLRFLDPALRQWLITFEAIPEASRITFQPYREGKAHGEPTIGIAGRTGQAAFEIVTDGASEIVAQHNIDHPPRVRVIQRWLVPTRTIAVGSTPRTLLRSGRILTVLADGGTLTLDLDSGLITHGPASEVPRVFALGAAPCDCGCFEAPASSTDVRPPASRPLSLTLSRDRIAAIYEDKLVIARPWGTVGALPIVRLGRTRF